MGASKVKLRGWVRKRTSREGPLSSDECGEYESRRRQWVKAQEHLQVLTPLGAAGLREVARILLKLKHYDEQYGINGGDAGSANVWIVKPSGKSRGRGIRIFRSLQKLLAYTDVEKHKEAQWVAQKYIENPLIIARRKFDKDSSTSHFSTSSRYMELWRSC